MYIYSQSWLVLVVALRPQTPKHIRGGWSHYTDTSEPVDGGVLWTTRTILSVKMDRENSLTLIWPKWVLNPYLLIRSQTLIDCATGPGYSVCLMFWMLTHNVFWTNKSVSNSLWLLFQKCGVPLHYGDDGWSAGVSSASHVYSHASHAPGALPTQFSSFFFFFVCSSFGCSTQLCGTVLISLMIDEDDHSNVAVVLHMEWDVTA
jgi:hypothetical protein